MGIEPTRPAWKAGILAIELHPHLNKEYNITKFVNSQVFFRKNIKNIPLFKGDTILRLLKEIIYTESEKYKYNDGQYICHISAHPVRYFKTLACICLLGELFPAPTVACGTEKYKGKRAQWKKNITNYKVFQIHYTATCTKRCYS